MQSSLCRDLPDISPLVITRIVLAQPNAETLSPKKFIHLDKKKVFVKKSLSCRSLQAWIKTLFLQYNLDDMKIFSKYEKH